MRSECSVVGRTRQSTGTDSSTGPTHPNWIEQIGVRPTYIDLAGVTISTKDGSTSLRISVLNRHPSADWTAHFKFDGFTVDSAEVHEMYSDDLSAQVRD
jgi:alpha-N-arabinofuranosidase